MEDWEADVEDERNIHEQVGGHTGIGYRASPRSSRGTGGQLPPSNCLPFRLANVKYKSVKMHSYSFT